MSQISIAVRLTLYVSDKCGSDQYVCDDYSCISGTAVCDGVLDCPHGEEETQCCKDCPSVSLSVTVKQFYQRSL